MRRPRVVLQFHAMIVIGSVTDVGANEGYLYYTGKLG